MTPPGLLRCASVSSASASGGRTALAAIHEAARSDANLMSPIVDAAKAYCTEQEICDVLRDVFGQHTDRPEF
jgi:methylmalonyl-CoA mutase N-terminal domain/subunit